MAFNIIKFLKGILISEENTQSPKEIEIIPGGVSGTKTTISSSQSTNRTISLPDDTTTLLGQNTVQNVSNKTITDSSINNTPIGQITPAAGSFTSLTANGLSVGGSPAVSENGTQTLFNKSLDDSSTRITDTTDPTKKIAFDVLGTTATTTTIASSQTVNRTLTLPDATDTLVARNTVDDLTNKTLTAPSINTPAISGGSIDNTSIGQTTPAAASVTTLNTTGSATVGANLTVQGNLTVNGTTTTVNSAMLDVTDANITVNKNGNDASAEGAGLTIDRTGVDGSIIYKDLSPSKFALGPLGSEDNVVSQTVTQTLSNKSLTDDNTFVVDNIDPTKRLAFDAGGATGTTTTVTASQTSNRSIALPDASTTLVGTDTPQLLSNKTLQFLQQSVATNAALTGAQQTLNTITTGIVRLTNVGLVSISGITAGLSGQQIIIENKTGVIVNILNDDLGAVLTDRILTGTSLTVEMAPDATLIFIYDSIAQRWHLAGGSGSGSGSSGINYIEDGGAELNQLVFELYNDGPVSRPVDGTGGVVTGVTFTRSDIDPLRGDFSFVFSKDNSNRQGMGVSIPFVIDSADLAKVLKIQLDYEVISGMFTAGSMTTDSDVIVYIYDITNMRTIEPSSIKFLSNSSTISDQFQAEFQTSANSLNYRLIFHIASTSTNAYSLKFDDIKTMPSEYVFGTPVTDEFSYTPIISGFGTVTNVEFVSARCGDKQYIRGRFTAGTPTAVEATVTYPTGLVSKSFTQIMVAGYGARSNNTSQHFAMLARPNVNFISFGGNNGGTSGTAPANGNAIAAPGEVVSFFAEVPIAGLSSSVQMSDQTSTRVVDFTGYVPTNQALTANVTNLTLTSEKDSHGAWTGTSYVVPVAGDYKVSGTSISALTNGTFLLFLNNVLTKRIFSFNTTSYASGGILLPNLKVGDTLQIRTDANVTIAGNAVLPYQSTFNIERISGPSQIAATETIAASYYLSVNQTIAVGAQINFDSKEYDTHNSVTTGAGVWKFTAPVSGVYTVLGTANSIATANNFILYKNNAIYKTAGGYTNSNQAFGNFVVELRLNAGDFIDVRTNNGGTFVGGALPGAAQSNISIKRIGL